MSGSLRRIQTAAAVLLRQNRVLLVFLVLWPCALTAILVAAAHGRPQPGDAGAVLQQELLYGLALVALRAASALGAEQKAGRLPQLLGRALGRGELLAALAAARLAPFAAYLAIWAANAVILARLDGRPIGLIGPGLTEVAIACLLCGAGTLFATMLPAMGAAAATGLLLAGVLAAGARGAPVAAALYRALVSAGAVPWVTCALLIAAGAALGIVAVAVFRRKDLSAG